MLLLYFACAHERVAYKFYPIVSGRLRVRRAVRKCLYFFWNLHSNKNKDQKLIGKFECFGYLR